MYSVAQKILASLVLIVSSVVAIADDIDIINRQIPIKTNILFVMDLSGSMDYLTESGVTRLSELQGAFQDIITDTDFEGINIGLSVFSGAAQDKRGSGRAHGISYPVSPVTGKSPQEILNDNPAFSHKGISYMPAVNNTTMLDSTMSPPEVNTRMYLKALSSDSTIWSAGGKTPLVDALYEAALYFSGGSVKWGLHEPDHISAAHPSTYRGSLTNKTITPACISDKNNPNYNRVSCTQGACGATEVCRDKIVRSSSPINTGNNCMTVSERCQAPGRGGTCGLNTNCRDQLSGFVHICEAFHTTITSCTNAHSTWKACEVESVWTPSTDTEGNVTWSPTGSRIKCKEMRTYCDAPDTYMCDKNELACTQCPGPQGHLTAVTYKTPIKEKCPANGIVLLSDGEPTENESAGLIASMIGSYANGCDTGSDDGRCGPELAKYLANEDQNLNLPDVQTVSTYTVGLELPPGSPESAYLEQLATAGNGSFVNANNRVQLTAAFKEAILAVAKRERTFSAPSYTVNTATQLTHDKYVYVPIFDRAVSAAWTGNLKKYELKNGKLYGKNLTGALVEATDASGRLKADVQDLWFESMTGGIVQNGGVANKIPTPASRKLYTDAGINASNILLGVSHELKISNSAITNTLLAPSSSITSQDRQNYIKFIRGEKSDGTPRHHMGDIIHSKPLQLAYSSTETVIFVGTNEGYLHAINANTGVELFAFMPSELLKNIKPQYENTILNEHFYGVDGPMKLWFNDLNKNGIKDIGEDAYIYFGLRRGGESYYALKLHDSMTGAPTLKWKITAGDTNFSNLGYTWSEPTLAKLRYEKNGTDTGEPKPVLVFGGGYVDDNNGESAQNTKGSEVFVVDALTGEYIWDTSVDSSSSIQFAVPAKIRTVDADRNGSIDRLYFGDTGGNVWRVDLGGTGADRYKMNMSVVTHLARLGDGSSKNGANDRKFFTEPDVAFLKYKGKYALSISIGSGSRPNPLNMGVENYFFMVLDKDVFNRPSTIPTLITSNNLQDAPVPSTMNLVPDLNNTTSKKGWKMRLAASGEKSLSTALTFQNKVLFTTLVIKKLTATNYNSLECGLNNTNEARLYALDLLTGDAVLDLDSATKSDTDPFVTVTGGEILETPQIVYGNFVNDSGGACTSTTKKCARSFSIHVGKGPSVAGSSTHTSKSIPVSKTLPRVYWLDKSK